MEKNLFPYKNKNKFSVCWLVFAFCRFLVHNKIKADQEIVHLEKIWSEYDL